MNKSSVVVQNSAEAVPKDTLHNKKKSGSIKEPLSDTTPDDSDRAQGHYSKNTSHFDYSNLGLFFGGRPAQPKAPTEGVIGKVDAKKKPSEPTSGKDFPALKHQSSKDFSNLDELCENTTIINNPSENKTHSKKKSNEMTFSKNADDDVNDISQTFFLENSFLKQSSKNKSREKSFSSLFKGPKDDKIDQEIAHDIYKLGLDANPEDQDKSSDNRLRDLKVPQPNLKGLERIKNKALPNRQPLITSVIPDPQQTSSPRINKLNKGVAMSPLILQYQDQEVYNDDSSAQDEFIKEFFETSTSKNRNSSDDIPLDKSKEISHDDLNPHLLTEKTTNKNPRKVGELNLDSSRDNRQRPNISLVSTDSTIDSENLNHPHDHQNNSFSTPFSGASGSFNNSGKLDLSSPLKDGSTRIHSENSEINYMNTYSLQRNMSMLNNNRMSMIPPQQQQQQQRMSVNLNQSCMSFHGGYGSGNNSDRSTNNLSFTGSDDFLQNAFSNNDFGSLRSRTPQSFINQQNFNVSSSPNMLEQFFIVPQNQNNNFNMMNQSMSQQIITNPSASSNAGKTTPSGKTNTPNNNNNNNNNSNGDKNHARSKRRTQEAEEGNLYDINVDKLETYGRTTVMIRNIPNKYDLPLIAQTIDKNHKGKYDFFYLPIDFSNRCNFGYAFINFTDTKFIKDFYLEFNGKKWEKFNSEKICEIKYARIQGYQNLMQHFQYSRVMNQQDKKLRPYIPPKLSGLPNKHKIEELVRQQKLESANNGKEKQSR